MIIIHAGMDINPEKEQEFLDAVFPVIQASRAESGNISYDLMKDTEKEHVFTMVEVWSDSRAVEEHGRTTHFTEFVKMAPTYLTKSIDLKRYEGSVLDDK